MEQVFEPQRISIHPESSSYPTHSSPAYAASHHTLLTPLPHIPSNTLPLSITYGSIRSTLLSCTYWWSSHPLHTSPAYTTQCHTLLMVLRIIQKKRLFNIICYLPSLACSGTSTLLLAMFEITLIC